MEEIQSWSGDSTPLPFVPGSKTTELGRYFLEQAEAAFASGKFVLQGIVFAPGSPCEIGSGQSYATNLIEVIGDSARVFPLCESYAPALGAVKEFAQSLLETDYTLELADDEQVTAVVVIASDETERTIEASDYTFDESTGVLSLDADALSADLILRARVDEFRTAVVGMAA